MKYGKCYIMLLIDRCVKQAITYDILYEVFHIFKNITHIQVIYFENTDSDCLVYTRSRNVHCTIACVKIQCV